MAYPTIVFNASTGSDTAASGAGPATAVTGTGASLNATTAVDLSADSPDLSGVATDGSACLWVQTSSGRQFSKVTAVDNSTKIVTVQTAYTVTESSRTWAIGGKRATWDNADSRTVFGGTTSIGFSAGWIIETETDQTLSSVLNISGTGTAADYIVIKGDSTTTIRTINQTQNTDAINGDGGIYYVAFKNLKITNSNATKTSARGIFCRYGPGIVENCIFGDSSNKLLTAIGRSGGPFSFTAIGCEFQYITSSNGPFELAKQAGSLTFINCYSHHNTGCGFNTGERGSIIGCIASFNGTDGIRVVTSVDQPNNVDRYAYNCTCHGNSGDGIDLSGASVGAVVVNCNLTQNGGYGIRSHANTQNLGYYNFNNFGTGGTANSSGARLNLDAGSNDLEVDPEYTDAANGDYSIGTNLKAKGFPKFDKPIGINSSTYSYVDIGAAQRQESAAGGGVRIPNIRGGADQ